MATPRNVMVALSLGTSFMVAAQMVGTTQSGGETPSEVKPAALTPSVLQGDVDLFTGTYSASYPLGTVSTPGGLSYSLSLQYNPAITGGSTPTLQDGIPYGEGWSLNVPTITVSNAYVHHLTPTEEQDIFNTIDDRPDIIHTFDEDLSNLGPDGTGRDVPEVTDGYGVWYAPTLSIPGLLRVAWSSSVSGTMGRSSF